MFFRKHSAAVAERKAEITHRDAEITQHNPEVEQARALAISVDDGHVEFLRVRREPQRPSERHLLSDDIRQLVMQGRVEEAEELLLKLVKAAEHESTATGLGVDAAPYERLAIIYRKQRRYEDEIEILERFARQKHAPGVTPGKLLNRLKKARIAAGTPPPRVAERARSPVGSAERFVHAIRTATHYGGSPVVEKDAPIRTRGETAPAYTKVVAPQPIPPYESRILVRPEMDLAQAAFYAAWRTDFENGKVWQAPAAREEGRLAAYGYTYAKDLIAEARSDPGAAAEHLERLAAAYPRLRDHVAPWARDAWLLAGDLKGALDCVPTPQPGGVNALGTDLRLTLKHFLGLRLDARELFCLYAPKVTPAVREHMDALVAIVQSRLDAEHQAGANYLDHLFLDGELETSGWPLWNATTQVVVIDDALYGRLSELEAGHELAANLQRAAENALREDIGLPQVGQGWVGETRLFVELRNALDTEVVQHGVPDGFGQQHFDVWIPAWRVGVEYQGLQHFEPVEFFGGEEAFKQTIERDRQKQSKAERLDIEIVYVQAGYELDEVVARVEAARTDPSGPPSGPAPAGRRVGMTQE